MRVSAVLASSLGNLLEWYDFGLFAGFSTLFARLFFPHTAPHVAILEVLGIYALGFVCRPLGALLFGHLGDRLGRVKTLRISIFLITLPTIAMGFAPTFAACGIYAPLFLVLLRLIQGISLGGEYTGIIIYLTEIAPKQHRALFACLASTVANLGLLLANGVAGLLQHFLSATAFETLGWRLAFIVGGLLGGGILYGRRFLIETEAFKLLQDQQRIISVPVLAFMRSAWHKMFFCLSLLMLGSVLYYTCFIYLSTFLQQTQATHVNVYFLQSLCLMGMLLLVPLGGWLCDRIGRQSSFLLISGSVILCTWPCFYWLNQGGYLHIGLALIIFTLISSLEQGTTSVTVVEQFPAPIRYTGVSLSYNLPQAIFGGTAPLIAAWLMLIKHNPLAPAFYLIAIASVTFLSSLFFLRDTRGMILES